MHVPGTISSSYIIFDRSSFCSGILLVGAGGGDAGIAPWISWKLLTSRHK